PFSLLLAPMRRQAALKELLRFFEKRLRRRFVGVAADAGEVLEDLALLARERRRHLHLHAHELVAGVAAAQAGHSLPAEAKGRAALGGGGNLQRRLAGERGHLDVPAQCREREL